MRLLRSLRLLCLLRLLRLLSALGVLTFAAGTATAGEPDPDIFLGAALLGAGGTFYEAGGRAAYTPSVWVGAGMPVLPQLHLGGVARMQAYIPGGVDIGLLGRVAFGSPPMWFLALDVGPSARTWGGGDYGRIPLDIALTASLVGLQLGGGFSPVDLRTGNSHKNSFAVTLGVDAAQVLLFFAALGGGFVR